MNTEFTFQGYWWLPGQEEEKVPGTLRYFPGESTSLETLGELFHNPTLGYKKITKILGITDNGKLITLVDCRTNGHSRHFPGIIKQRFRSQTLAIGLNLEEDKPLTFRKISFRCTDLPAWINRNGFTIDCDYEAKTLNVHYSLPPVVEAQLDEKYKFSIEISTENPNGSKFQKEVNLTEIDWLSLETRVNF
ncbi:MAG: hypothetical protein ACM3O3_03580 [Syntrophothermus sp.]